MAMGARRAEGNVTYDQECRYSVEEYVNILLQTLYPPILVGSGEKTSKTIHGFSHGREWFEQGSEPPLRSCNLQALLAHLHSSYHEQSWDSREVRAQDSQT